MIDKQTTKLLDMDQTSLLQEVLIKRAPDTMMSLLQKVRENSLNRFDRIMLCELISAELLDTGLNAELEPLQRGLKLEQLIDVINRPTLFK